MAGCQVVPPSVETSTPATRPPPASVAVPVTVTVSPLPRLAPADGEVITAVGAAASVLAVAVTSPVIRPYGCTPMSASRFTVACCIRESGAGAVPWTSWLSSSPQDHCTVPALNTRAPLGALYIVSEWVAVPGATVEPKSVSFSSTSQVAEDSRNSPSGRKPLSRSSFHS